MAQIEDGFPEPREPEADERMHPAMRLSRALSRVSEQALVPRGARLVVLIDGLDEYDPPPEQSAGDPLAAFLPDTLPAGVRLLCAILSVWLTRRERAGAVVPYHLVRRQVADWDQPAVIAASLAAQIEAAFPDCRDPAARHERRLLDCSGGCRSSTARRAGSWWSTASTRRRRSPARTRCRSSRRT